MSPHHNQGTYCRARHVIIESEALLGFLPQLGPILSVQLTQRMQ